MTRGSSADWIVANIDTSGFYRVNYDQENWERLLATLQTDPQVQNTHKHLYCTVCVSALVLHCCCPAVSAVKCSFYLFVSESHT